MNKIRIAVPLTIGSELMAVKKTSKPKREIIIAGALKLFRAKGYDGTSMRELAGTVGMDAASMYYYIRSKDEILEEVCFRIANRYISHLDSVEDASLPGAEKVRTLISLHVRLVLEDAIAVSVANHEWRCLTKKKLTAYKALRQKYESRFAAIVGQAIKDGEFRAVNTDVALYTLLSSLRWLEAWYKPERNIGPDDLERDVTTLLMRGLEPAGAL